MVLQEVWIWKWGHKALKRCLRDRVFSLKKGNTSAVLVFYKAYATHSIGMSLIKK
jgi:3-phenylpropionate/cinnamic acid dioxygenase small subunit